MQSVPGDTTRPITDRVKEALFDIIGGDVKDSRWWDVFAGTGAVGIEALSRGASYARLSDLHRLPLDTIRNNLSDTGLVEKADVVRADAFALIASQADRQFDYVYIAPPQHKGMWEKALALLDSNSAWLSGDAWVVVQIDPKEYKQLTLRNVQEFDQRRYGTTLLSFYARS